ncbi:sigma 54-interacting transcriptional regulator, partial [Klebsiella variicola]|uniref:sigma 54-interacting transcriptional regulator n=1 Tax=Klebsiella variicola TaxID=244366 RepID=UPI002B056343
MITFKSLRSVQQMASSVNKSLPFSFDDIICESEVMMNLIDFAKKIAISPYTVLIRGETGTGKELFARAIHNASDRSAHPFAPINCAALP